MKNNLHLKFGGKLKINEHFGVLLDDANLDDVLREAMGVGDCMVRLTLTVEPLADAGLFVEVEEKGNETV